MTEERLAQLVTEINDFASLLRARITGALADTPDGERSPAEQAWEQVFGHTSIAASSWEEFGEKISAMVQLKTAAAAFIAANLALTVAQLTGKDAIKVIDEAEAEIRENLEAPGD